MSRPRKNMGSFTAGSILKTEMRGWGWMNLKMDRVALMYIATDIFKGTVLFTSHISDVTFSTEWEQV